MKLSSLKDQYISTISRVLRQSNSKENESDNYFKEKNSFPLFQYNYEKKSLLEMRQMIVSNQKITLKYSEDTFPFKLHLSSFPTNLKKINKVSDLNNMINFILMAAIKLINFPHYKNCEIILTSINWVLKNRIVKDIITKNLLISAFYHLYLIFIYQKNNNDDFRICLNILSIFFFSLDSSFNSELYELISTTSLRFLKPNTSSLDQISSEFIIFVDTLIKENSSCQFPSKYALNIIQTISGSIVALDMTALFFFSTVCSIIDDETLLSFTQCCLASIVNLVKEDVDFIPSKSELMNPCTFSKLNIIIRSFNTNVYVCNKLYSFIQDTFESSETRNQVIALKLILLEEIIHGSLTVQYIPLLSDYIWTCSNSNGKYYTEDIVEVLKQISIKIIIDSGVDIMRAQLDSLSNEPQLFLNVIDHLMSTQEILQMHQEDIATFCLTLIHLLHNFQKCTEYSDIQKKVFCFLYNIIDSTYDSLYNHSFFTEVFLTLLNDEASIDFVLNIIYLHYPTSKYENFLDTFSKNFSNLENNSSINKILSTINKILQVNELSLSNKFCVSITSKLLDTLKHFLSKVSYTRETISMFCDFFLETISFHFLSHIHISSGELFIMNESMKKLKCLIPTSSLKQYYLELFSKLVQLLAHRKLPSLHPSFIIAQPKLLSILFESFVSTEFSREMFSLIKGLLIFSKENCILANQAEFDIFLLTWVQKHSYEYSKESLELFEMISKHISSYSAVLKFISLLNLGNDAFLRPYHKNLMDSLSNLLLPYNESIYDSIPLDDGYEVDFIPEHVFAPRDYSFTIAFKIYPTMNNSQCHSQIIAMKTNTSGSFGIVLYGNTILISINNPGYGNYVLKPDMFLHLNEWNSVAFNVNFTLNKLTPFINGKSLNDILISSITFPNNFMNARIGGITHDSIPIENPSIIKYIGFFPLLAHQQIIELHEYSYEEGTSNKLDPVFFCSIYREGDFIFWKKIFESNVTIEAKQFFIPKNNNFEDIFVNKAFHLILPIFGQWNCTFENLQIIPNFIEQTIHLLYSVLSYSKAIHQNLYHQNTFTIISSYLLEYNGCNITYNLYLLFVNLSSVISSNDLLEQKILLNIEIWIKCDAINHQRVLKHWSRVLFPTNLSLIQKIISFNDLLCILRYYYFYTPIGEFCSTESVNKIKKDSDFNTYECRKLLCNIALSFLQSRVVDLKPLISHIITNEDLSQVKDLIQFLTKIIQIQNAQFNNQQYFPLILFLCGINDRFIFLEVLQFIMHAQNVKLFTKHNIDEFIQVIIQNVEICMITEETFIDLITMTEKHHQFFPLCTKFAFHLGHSALQLVYSTLNPHKDFVHNQMMMEYTILSLFHLNDDDLISQILKFLISCSTDAILFLYCLTSSNSFITKSLLKEYGNYIINSKRTHHEHRNYFRLIRQYLFFHKEKQIIYETENDNLIQNTLNNHQYFTKMNIRDSDIMRNAIYSFRTQQITNVKIDNNSISNKDLSLNKTQIFSYRVDTNGIWEDEDLAIQALKIHISQPNLQDNEIIMLILSILIRYKVENETPIISQCLETIDMNDLILIKYINFYHYNKCKQAVPNDISLYLFSQVSSFCEELSSSSDNDLETVKSKLTQEKFNYHSHISHVSQQLYQLIDPSILTYSNNQCKSFITDVYQNQIETKRTLDAFSYILSQNSPWSCIQHVSSLDHDILFGFNNCPSIFMTKKANMKWNLTRDIPKNNAEAELLKPLCHIPGKLLKLNSFFDAMITILSESVIIQKINRKAKLIHISEIKQLLPKAKNSFEIILFSGKSYYILFNEHCPISFTNLLSIQNNPIEYYTHKWVNRKISTFDYIIHINNISGRSFNDYIHYIIFPYVLKDYQSNKLNLHNSAQYRDFSQNFTSQETNIFLKNNQIMLNHCELIPEYYYFFDFIYGQNAHVPKWACDIFEFIYMNRKALESDYSSAHINKWFDLIWGIKNKSPNNQTIPRQIFSGLHPKRKIHNYRTPIIKETRAIQTSFVSIDSSSITNIQNNKFEINMIDEFITNHSKIIFDFNANAKRYSYDSNSFKDKLKPKSCIINPIEKKYNIFDANKPKNHGAIHKISSLDGKYIVDEIKKNVYTLKFGQTIDHLYQSTDELLVINNEEDGYFISTDIYSVLYVHNLKSNKLLFKTNTYCDQIECIGINSGYHVIICGSKSGTLLFVSLNNGEIYKTIDLNHWKPKIINISDAWGFITVFSSIEENGNEKYKLLLFSINGLLIKECEVDFVITQLKTFKTTDGFDYTLIATENGSIYVFESFYLLEDVNLKKHKINEPILSIDYLLNENCAIAVTKKGKIVFIPITLC
ncbi:hypothetical protein TRFO_14947 [Tritrichomonas foetus]|uniref:BEACH domain-containing protein n=1 Tax=Tritrichomonas foetus TaxID=1144522 RepID=A0A1J4KTQ6_9EUKA|nr:hypothetical protein TRFO_14947 [Tritrichomonas foetus]|eukprot:OHT14643.1 hypothetical protein TRFO_14947 [Tritrichomonas foetus]